MAGFDARSAKQLQAGKHIVVEDFPGLRLEATAAGKAWIYRYNAGGKMRQIKIGQWPALSLPSAITKWQELKDARSLGVDPALAKKAERQAKRKAVYTVAQAVEDYYQGHLLVNRQEVGANAVYARLVKAIESIESDAAESITRRVAFDLISGLAENPVLAKSVRNELGAAWAFALDAGLLPENTPNFWRDILAGKLRSKGAMRDGKRKGTAKRTLSEAELKTLLEVDLKRFSQQVRDFLMIQLWTCTRGAEIVQMRHDQIADEKDGVWWTVPKEFTKGRNNPNATDLRVPLDGRALEIVQRLRLQKGLLFPSVSRQGVIGPQKQTYMQSKVNYLQPYCKQKPEHVRERLTVTHWSPHDLRRTGRTMLAQLGCPREVAESILGHVMPGVEGVYNIYQYDPERRHWLTLWSSRLSLISPTVSDG